MCLLTAVGDHQVMKARGWKQSTEDDWDFMYADVGWIHENITYGNVSTPLRPRGDGAPVKFF